MNAEIKLAWKEMSEGELVEEIKAAYKLLIHIGYIVLLLTIGIYKLIVSSIKWVRERGIPQAVEYYEWVLVPSINKGYEWLIGVMFEEKEDYFLSERDIERALGSLNREVENANSRK